jgi:hypothetical protein
MRLAKCHAGGAVIVVAGSFVHRDRLQMGGDITNARCRRLAVHVCGSIMCLGGAPMSLCCGQMRPASPELRLIDMPRRRDGIGLCDWEAGRQLRGELTELFSPSRRSLSPGFIQVTDVVTSRHVVHDARKPRQ